MYLIYLSAADEITWRSTENWGKPRTRWVLKSPKSAIHSGLSLKTDNVRSLDDGVRFNNRAGTRWSCAETRWSPPGPCVRSPILCDLYNGTVGASSLNYWRECLLNKRPLRVFTSVQRALLQSLVLSPQGIRWYLFGCHNCWATDGGSFLRRRCPFLEDGFCT